MVSRQKWALHYLPWVTRALMHLLWEIVITTSCLYFANNESRRLTYLYLSISRLLTLRLAANSPGEQQFIWEWQPEHTHVNRLPAQACNLLLLGPQKTAPNYSNRVASITVIKRYDRRMSSSLVTSAAQQWHQGVVHDEMEAEHKT